jgi:hypothetical protein
MANGPLGGNMGTPPVPPQPPQVSFETTAQSRGNFNNFLKSIPPTTALTPLPPMGSTPMMPTPMPPMGGNPMANIDIFNQPMGMMGMNQPPMNPMMQPPMQQPMMMADGGNVDKNDIGVENFADKNGGIVDGLPRMWKSSPDQPMTYLSYITGEEQDFLRKSNIHNKDDPNRIGQPGPKGVPSFDDPGGDTEDQGSDFSGGDDSSSNNDGSDNNNDDNTSTDEDFNDSTDLGTDPGTDNDDDGFSFDDEVSDYQTDDSGVYTGGGGDNQDNRPSTNIVNVGAGSNLQYNPQFTADNLEDRGLDPKGFMSAENYAQTTQGQAASQAEMNDAMAIDQAMNQAPAGNLAANIVSTYNPQQYGLGLDLDDPLGLGFNTAGMIEGARAVQGMRDPEQFTQVAGLGNIPGADVAAITRSSFAPTIGGVEDDLIEAITQGRSDLYSPFTNNPGNLKQAREDLTTETIKGFNADGTPRTGPALFNTLEAGQKALDDQLGRYGDRGISTPTDFVQTYLGTDRKENPLANELGYINAVRNAVGDNFDLSNPATRDNITNAITRQELGQKGIDALGNQVTAATGLDQVFNAPITSAPNVEPEAFDMFGNRMSELTGQQGVNISNQAMQQQRDRSLAQDALDARGDLDSINYSALSPAPVDEGFLPVGEFNVQSPASGIDIFSPEKATVTQNISPQNTLDRIARNNRNINEIRADLGSRVPDTALETMAGRRDIGTIGTIDRTPDLDALESVRQISSMPQTIGIEVPSGFADETRGNIGFGRRDNLDDALSTISPDVLSSIGREQRIDDVNTFRSTVPDAAKIFGGRQVSNLPTGAPVDFEEQVGKPYSGVDIDKIEQFYNAPTTFDKLGIPPGMFSTALNFAENKARDFVAADLISGNFDPIYDSDGKITGSRNPRTGQVQSGMDMNAPVDSGDDNPLILKPIAKAKKDEKDDEKEDKPPNVIGGVDPKAPVSSGSAVVDSPFTTNVGDFKPVGFSSGDLNKLIAAITGVAAPKSMKKGGVAGYAEGGRVMQALDNLLATG